MLQMISKSLRFPTYLRTHHSCCKNCMASANAQDPSGVALLCLPGSLQLPSQAGQTSWNRTIPTSPSILLPMFHARRDPVSKHQPVKDATSARNHPTSDIPYLCDLQDGLSFTLPPINMEVKSGPSNSSYLVPFKKQPFSIFMFMGGRCQLSMFQI